MLFPGSRIASVSKAHPSSALARLLWRSIAVTYVLAGCLGSLSFSIWSQITDHSRVGISELDIFNEAHALRYLLLLPTLELSDFLNLEADHLFSIQICAFILSTSFLVDKSRRAIVQEQRPWSWWRLSLGLVFILTSFFMNGRMAFGFLSISLILYVQSGWQAKRIPLWLVTATYFLSLLLASVSTGVFTVALGAILFWTLVEILFPRGQKRKTSVILGFSCLLVLAVSSPVLVTYTDKNLEFFGTTFNMLSHGPGEYVAQVLDQGGWFMGVLLACLGLGILIGMIVCTVRVQAWRSPLSVLTCTLTGGLFGYSTFLMGLPAVLLLISLAGFSAKSRPVQQGSVPPSPVPSNPCGPAPSS